MTPPPPRRRYGSDPLESRRAKEEEVKRLAEMKRRREAAFSPSAPPPAPARATAAPEVRPGPKDPLLEGRRAKAEELNALKARRARELVAAAKDPRDAHRSRWAQQAEAQAQTVASRLQDLFGQAPGKKPSREQARKRR